MNPKKHQIYLQCETKIPVSYFESDLFPCDIELNRAFTKYGFHSDDYVTVRFYNYKKKFHPKLDPGYSYIIFEVDTQKFKYLQYEEYSSSSYFALYLSGFYELSDKCESYIEYLQFDEDM